MEYAVSPGCTCGDPCVREELKALALHRLERAREAFAEGDQLLTAGSARGAVNRLYYAAFYAARSLLATKNLESSKHSRAIALFQQHFVKTGDAPVEVARVLQQSFDARQLADYGDYAEPVGEEVIELRTAVGRFVSFCLCGMARQPSETRDWAIA